VNSISHYQPYTIRKRNWRQAVYLTTQQRASIKITAANTADGGSNSVNTTVVLSDLGVNMQESHQEISIGAQLPQNGSGEIDRVAPGTYRLTMYQSASWARRRVDGCKYRRLAQHSAEFEFTPETRHGAAHWTIGNAVGLRTEFLNGHNAAGSTTANTAAHTIIGRGRNVGPTRAKMFIRHPPWEQTRPRTIRTNGLQSFGTFNPRCTMP